MAIYLALPDVEMSRLRVAERVSHGGHDVPDRDLARRFKESALTNLQLTSNSPQPDYIQE
ncbi:MAG TPA: hypothetical protein ENI88_08850 [Desulfobulbus sp.]|nr:hypothetical protein [Desulfobulbus sp.]